MNDVLDRADQACFAQLAAALQAVGRPAGAPPRPRAADAAGLERETDLRVAEAERLMRAGSGEQALAHCDQAWPLAEQSGSAVLMGALWHVRAVCHEHAGRLRAAMEAGYRGLAAYATTPAVERRVRLLSLQALILAQLGDVAEALALVEHAADLLPQLGDSARDRCVFWMNVAATHEVLGDLERAIEAGDRSCRIAAELAPGDPLAAHACGHALSYRMVREEALAPGSAAHAEAIERLRQHLASDQAAGRLDVLPFRADAGARSLIAAGRLDEARELLRIGLNAATRSGNAAKRGVLEMRLAELERLSGGFKAAAGHIALALELLASGEDRRELAGAHLENSRLHEAQQRWRAALDCFKRYAEIQQELLQAQANVRAQALEIRQRLQRSGVGAGLV